MAKTNETRLRTECDGPIGYASRLAGYIKDTSYVRAMTVREFGESRAPSVETIRALQAEHVRQRERFASQGFVDAGVDDANDWQPAATAEAKQIEVRRYERSTYTPVHIVLPDNDDERPVIRSHTDLIAAVAKAFGVTYTDLIGHHRKTVFVCARAVAAKILHERGNPLAQVGRFLGGRDHSTIINLIRSFDDRSRRFPEIARVYSHLSAAALVEAA